MILRVALLNAEAERCDGELANLHRHWMRDLKVVAAQSFVLLASRTRCFPPIQFPAHDHARAIPSTVTRARDARAQSIDPSRPAERAAYVASVCRDVPAHKDRSPTPRRCGRRRVLPSPPAGKTISTCSERVTMRNNLSTESGASRMHPCEPKWKMLTG